MWAKRQATGTEKQSVYKIGLLLVSTQQSLEWDAEPPGPYLSFSHMLLCHTLGLSIGNFICFDNSRASGLNTIKVYNNLLVNGLLGQVLYAVRMRIVDTLEVPPPNWKKAAISGKN